MDIDSYHNNIEIFLRILILLMLGQANHLNNDVSYFIGSLVIIGLTKHFFVNFTGFIKSNARNLNRQRQYNHKKNLKLNNGDRILKLE